MTTSIKFTLRIPAELKEWIKTRSIRNVRSTNTEIQAILAAVKQGEEAGTGFERFANSSGILATVKLFEGEDGR